MVIVSSYEAAYEVMVTRGKDFAGRQHTFRNDILSENGNGIMHQSANTTWKNLRMVTQQSVKQYDEGLGRIETMVHEMAQQLIQGIITESKDGDNIYLTVAKNMATLIVGIRPSSNDPLLQK